MSSAWAAVRFPDGRIRYCTYSGTVDLLMPRLSDTIGMAWALNKSRKGWEDTEPVGFDLTWHVEIYSDYGNGMWWKGKSRWNEVEPYSCDPFDTLEVGNRVPITDGAPDWVFSFIGK